jgi:two-component system CheB/CheR fusion protein
MKLGQIVEARRGMNETKNPDFEIFLDYLRHTRGFDFTGYKRLSLTRRVSQRMRMIGVDDYLDYRDYLEVNPDEFIQLFNMILINVTSFFRDEPAWKYLAQTVIPKILAIKAANEPIRVWCAGCASGEEAYSLAMLLAEALGLDAFLQRVKLYATDIDEEALAQARRASYGEKEVQAIPSDLRQKYFTQNGELFNFRIDLRHNVIFGHHDLFQDAPISRLDLLVCRNTLMYFNADAQRAILNRFHFGLNENGYLFLGKAEMLLTQRQLFDPAELKYRIFVKSGQLNPRERLLALGQKDNAEPSGAKERQNQLIELVFNSTPLAQVVVDAKGNVTMINACAQQLFALEPRDRGRQLQDLEFSYRPVELRSLLEQAYQERRAVQRTSIERLTGEEALQYLDLLITPLYNGEPNGVCLGASIIFSDVTANMQLQNQLLHTNQELETAHEELQSANEELETTNIELRERSDELVEMNAFLNSILTGLRAGVVVVDRQLMVLEWNPRMEDLWGLRANEVQGRSILDLDIGFQIAPLSLQTFLTQDNDYQETTLEAINRRGKSIRCRVTATKFRNPGEGWRGLILLVEELTEGPKSMAK